MTINSKQDGNTMTMAIEGRIDTLTSGELINAIQDLPEEVTSLILDFTNVFYLSSAGLRAVLTAQNKMNAKNGSMVIRGAAKNIVGVIKVTGFDTFLTLE